MTLYHGIIFNWSIFGLFTDDILDCPTHWCRSVRFAIGVRWKIILFLNSPRLRVLHRLIETSFGNGLGPTCSSSSKKE